MSSSHADLGMSDRSLLIFDQKRRALKARDRRRRQIGLNKRKLTSNL